MKIYINLFLFFTCLFTFFPSDLRADGPAGIIYEAIVPEAYRSESNFTQIPALVGGLILSVPAYMVGGLGYTVGYGIGAPIGKEKEFALYTGAVLGFGTLRLGSTTTGAPFYALEKTLYDLPKSIIDPEEEITEEELEIHQMKKKSDISKRTFVQYSSGKIVRVKATPQNPSGCIERSGVGQKKERLKQGTGRGQTMGGGLQLAYGYQRYCDKVEE